MFKYIANDLLRVLRFLPLGIVGGLAVGVILRICNIRYKKKNGKSLPGTAAAFLTMYVIILLSITFLSRESGSVLGLDLELFSTWGINDRNNAYVIENILLFIPFGWGLAWVFPRGRNIFYSGLYGLGMSIMVEYLQLVTGRGYFQIDDILTNLLGTLLGCILFAVFGGFLRKDP